MNMYTAKIKERFTDLFQIGSKLIRRTTVGNFKIDL
jgi:hypothetical protein